MPKIRARKCYFCGKSLLNGLSKYCLPCSIFSHRLDVSDLTAEAQESVRKYIHKHQRFVCFYTGMILDLKDPKTSPWYCVFDHWVPGDDRRVVLTSFLINDIKTELSGDEFEDIVDDLHHFKKDGIKIKKRKLRYWRGFIPRPPEEFFSIPEGGPVIRKKCCVCGKPFVVGVHNEKYCRTCAELVWRMEVKKFPPETVKQVLDYIRKYGYVCYYTGMALNTTNPRSPWYFVLDHWMPGNPAKVVLTSALFNSMKSDLTEKEFWYYIKQLYNHRKYGTRVRKIRVTYWARLIPKSAASHKEIVSIAYSSLTE